MKEPIRGLRIEPRWPVALAVLAVLFLLACLPGRVRLVPIGVSETISIAVMLPMAAIHADHRKSSVAARRTCSHADLLRSFGGWSARHPGAPHRRDG
jgi:hypothetical protein